MKRKLVTYQGIEIIGDSAYIRYISTALKLLKRRAPRNFATVRKYIGRIEDFKRSGMCAWENPPTFYLSKKSAFYSLTWCASCILHDAHHAKLYLDNRTKGKHPHHLIYSGQKVELECIRRQILVSKRIGAPPNELAHLKSLDGNHFKVKRQWW